METKYTIKRGETKGTKKRPSVEYFDVMKANPLPEPNPHGLYFHATLQNRVSTMAEAEECISKLKASDLGRKPDK